MYELCIKRVWERYEESTEKVWERHGKRIDKVSPYQHLVKTICTTSRCTIKNLESGKKYWFRTFVVGSKGQRVMGDTLLSPFVQ